MTRFRLLALVAAALATGQVLLGSAVPLAAKECRLEQQCKWKNFKKVCVWVRVCH